ncbi:carboxymuconolactone decarboxylase family protein [uncultured Pseudodesulfovibrio sp.]|uniref:carboxymuconolactone decarboxylase family protein n=1 Tax=uncultured Pseudodesulfovibrio sp. TaxID=2035858 RepID=UPI0029C8ACAC|nr:carboxymuconolactone decarboxylase family protein [uncultured Pseudodesulfovibrio sp.]
MQNQGLWLEEFLACRKNYDNENPEVWELTLKTITAAFADGALGSKEKHLMAVAIGVKDHCAPCTLGHLQAAIKAGATKAEILETVGVTISMSGTTAMGGAWMVFKMMEEEGLF